MFLKLHKLMRQEGLDKLINSNYLSGPRTGGLPAYIIVREPLDQICYGVCATSRTIGVLNGAAKFTLLQEELITLFATAVGHVTIFQWTFYCLHVKK
jgi:hypothetical protein